jgi:membrane-associated phospholipid phosphatase
VVRGQDLTRAGHSAHVDLTTSADHGRSEAIAGLVLLGCSAFFAILMRVRPGANVLDRWGFDLVAKSPNSAFFIHTTDLGSPAVLVGGCVVGALIVVRRDRVRAVACLLGPLMAAVLVELILKPLVGRRFEGVLTYPSGTVTDVTAVATAWVVAVPRRARPVVVTAGALAVALVALAVTGLRWHYPSDALGGIVLGVGTVLLVDGLLHLGTEGRTRGDRPLGPDRMSAVGYLAPATEVQVGDPGRPPQR